MYDQYRDVPCDRHRGRHGMIRKNNIFTGYMLDEEDDIVRAG